MSTLRAIDWLFNRWHFDREVIVLCVCWYMRYKISLKGDQKARARSKDHYAGRLRGVQVYQLAV